MQKLKGALLISMLFALLYGAYMMYSRTSQTKEQADKIQVEDGRPVYKTDDSTLDMDSRTPLVKCYPVESTAQFDINQRMDFETRSAKGWVNAPGEADDGEVCIKETDAAVKKRLGE